jgi:hypothetical protein
MFIFGTLRLPFPMCEGGCCEADKRCRGMAYPLWWFDDTTGKRSIQLAAIHSFVKSPHATPIPNNVLLFTTYVL